MQQSRPPEPSWWRRASFVALVVISLSVALAVVGVALRVPWMVISGAVLATLGSGWLASEITDLYNNRTDLLVGVIVGCIAVGGGIAAMWVAVRERSMVVAAAGVAFAAVGSIPIAKAGVRFAEARARRAVSLGVALALAGGMSAVLGWSVVLIAILLAGGFVLISAGIDRYVEEASEDRQRRVATLAFVLVAAGVVVMLLGVRIGVMSAALSGVLLVVFGLPALTVGWRVLSMKPIGPAWGAAVGLVLVLAGVAVWPQWEEPFWLLMIVVALLVGIAMSFSWRGEAFLLLILAGGILVWSLSDVPDVADLDPYPGAEGRILALGDSYTSGEGSPAYFDGTNVADTNQCRRASTAYPYLVAQDLEMGLDFYACSGAKTNHIWDKAQMDDSPPSVVGGLAQIENPINPRVKAVVLSIGGNDALFGEIGQACLLPGSCVALRESWLVNVSRIGSDITTALVEIRERVEEALGEDVPIIVLPYPLLMSDARCGWAPLTQGERSFLSEFITVLDDRIRHSAAEAGVHFFRPAMFAFKGRRICDAGWSASAMNFFNLHPQQGDALDLIHPRNWVHGTFHPKPSGHAAIANVLAPWLDGLLEAVALGASANPSPDPSPEFTVRRVSMIGTVIVDPEEFPESMPCERERLDPFGGLLPLIDDRDSFRLNVSLRDPICYSRPDGTWGSWTPGEPSPEGPSGPVFSLEGTETRGRTILRIYPQAPSEGHGARQYFVYTEPHRLRAAADGFSTEPRVLVRVVEFCNHIDGCPHNVAAWTQGRLRDTAALAVVPALLVLAGGWLLGAGSRVAQRQGTIWKFVTRSGALAIRVWQNCRAENEVPAQERRGAWSVAVIATALPVVSFAASRQTPDDAWRIVGAVAVGMCGWAAIRLGSLRAVGLAVGMRQNTFVLSGVPVAASVVVGVVAWSVVSFAEGMFATSELGPGELIRVFAITAAAEELIYRGALLGTATKAFGFVAAVAIQAVSFGLWHVGPSIHEFGLDGFGDVSLVVLSVLATMLAALPLACVRFRARSIVPCILMHGCLNATVIFLGGLT